MAEGDDLYCEQQLIGHKDDLVVFPPINHENLQVASSIYGVDRFLESPSETSSPSSSSRRSGSSSSFSLSPSDSDAHPPLTACDVNGKSPRKPLYHEVEVLHEWWELLLVRVNSKLKNLLTWFSTTLRSFYPVLAIAIWWWMRVCARRRRVNGQTTDHLRDAIKERDERIVQLLQKISQMNELLVKHHKDILSRR